MELIFETVLQIKLKNIYNCNIIPVRCPKARIWYLVGVFETPENRFFIKIWLSMNMPNLNHWICRIFKIGQRHSISWVRNYGNQYQTRFLKIPPPPKKVDIFLKSWKGGAVFFLWGLLGFNRIYVPICSSFRHSLMLL